MNTTVDPPHQDRVTSLIFRPIPRNEFESVKQTGLEFVHSNSELVITTSLDGKFKVCLFHAYTSIPVNVMHRFGSLDKMQKSILKMDRQLGLVIPQAIIIIFPVVGVASVRMGL